MDKVESRDAMYSIAFSAIVLNVINDIMKSNDTLGEVVKTASENASFVFLGIALTAPMILAFAVRDTTMGFWLPLTMYLAAIIGTPDVWTDVRIQIWADPRAGDIAKTTFGLVSLALVLINLGLYMEWRKRGLR
jgi:hypothetical protein